MTSVLTPDGRVPCATVVTAYFPIPSKVEHEQYMRWIDNFLPIVPCNLVLFTSAALAAPLAARASSPTVCVRIRDFDTDVMPQATWAHWTAQHGLDQRRRRHTPQLYALWAAKAAFVRDAIAENPFGSTWFVWCDIGSFRDAARASFVRDQCTLGACSFPCPAVLSRLDPQRVYMARCSIPPSESAAADESTIQPGTGLPVCISYTTPRVCGGVIAGTAAAMLQWWDAVDDTRRRMLALPDGDARRFVGVDEFVYAPTAAAAPGLVALVGDVGVTYAMHYVLVLGPDAPPPSPFQPHVARP